MTSTPAAAVKTDADVVSRAQSGDAEAFAQLYERHKRRVYGICLRISGNTADAEDLTQEVFIRLHRKLSTFRGDSAFTTWLYRIAANTVLMYLRKSSVRHESTAGDDTIREQTDGIAKSCDGSSQLLDRVTLEGAIAQLPPGYRTVFTLHDVEGYEHEEIALMLGISTGTTKSQLHKARMNLRRALRSYGAA